MKLKLNKPLVFFDIEATGLDITSDKIIELCLYKIYPNGTEDYKIFRFNPEKHISEEATAINGITDSDVQDCPTFKEKSNEIFLFIQNCDLAGYNSNRFDIPMLVEEFSRCSYPFDIDQFKLIDVQTIFHKMEPRTLSAAYKLYCNKDLINAHSALADTKATYEILKSQLDRYDGELVNDAEWLANFCKTTKNLDLAGKVILNSENIPVFNFGKYKGKPVNETFKTFPNYYSWLMQGNFTQNTKQIFTKLKLKNSISK